MSMAVSPATALGVDIGGTTIKVGRVASDGSLTDTRTVPTPRDPHVLAEVIATEVDRTPEPVIGVVNPGIIDERTGVVTFAANLGWRDLPLQAILERRLGRRVVLGHDVRAGALAESLWGAGAAGDMLFMPLGTGIASALVLDGVVRGTGWAGEVGQVLVADPDHPGTRVPFEQIASASALAARYAAATGSSDVSAGARGVLERLADGDPVAAEIVRTAIDTLADLLADTAGLLGPVPIVLGGGLAEAGDAVLEPLRAALVQRLPGELRAPLRAAVLGSWAGCLGAGALALELRQERR
ncbi:ROK family protein [Ruania alkalisoli]|uniref:ROK family protein n=1 Tax=Ruania alkalisoli TaxID=2779775 RepID=A0A7M1SZ73_9MICO|nr:ROK family protein [Ruania alkalisoli]QOR72264.1 ROK family protein [Ruania alkalisoli]